MNAPLRAQPVALRGFDDLDATAADAALQRARHDWSVALAAAGAHEHPTLRAAWRVLSATTKSQVFALEHDEARWVIKRYEPAHEHRFETERLALRLLQPSAHVPRLLAAVRPARLLLLPYLPAPASVSATAIAAAIAELHRLLQRHRDRLARAHPAATLAERLHHPPGLHQAAEPAALREHLQRLLASFGPGHVGVALGDIKPGNLRADGATLVLIDRESLQIGGYELLDLLLVASLRPGGDPDDPDGAGLLAHLDWPAAIAAYCTVRRLDGYPWGVPDVARAMVELAVGLGFATELVDELELVARGCTT